jgi:YgiT-type zinc finger domain-containing protein
MTLLCLSQKGMVINMTCLFCKGDTEQRNKTHAVTLDNAVIIVKNVPAMVCAQCGEVYFSDEVMERLEAIINRLEHIIKEVAIASTV